jgi:hypothetical protein
MGRKTEHQISQKKLNLEKLHKIGGICQLEFYP